MKKVLYETGVNATSGLVWPVAIEGMESLGYHVTISREEPEKPEIERCEIGSDDLLGFRTFGYRHTFDPLFPSPRQPISGALDSPAFAGFEFADGAVGMVPWRVTLDGLRPRPPEHAKYVLFRKP